MTDAAQTAARTPLARRSREALSALALEFLLGMGVNLVPAAGSKVVHGIVLGLHVLIGLAIVVVAFRLLAVARREGLAVTAALWGLVSVLVAFVAGVFTLMLDSGWLSFLMALAFLAGAVFYVITLLAGSTRRPAA
ncbi:hypothetical protein [Amnibacterium sp.]|uniref:hypothetical protein n=1 Tax=Amnibacterium sp. TaxID=1872496 RepID=UPI003F7CC606